MSPGIERFLCKPEFSKDKSLRAAVYDAMFFSVMVGAAEAYLGTFGIHLAGSPVQIGILATLPPLIGAAFQLLGIRIMERNMPSGTEASPISRRRLNVTAASLQGLVWILIGSIPFLFNSSTASVWALIACVTIYFAIGNVVGPCWNSLIGDLVPEESRGRYFGYRNQQAGIVTVLALILGGFVLDAGREINAVTPAFCLLFIIACISRLFSAYWLGKYEDPPYRVGTEDRFSFLQFIKRAPKSNFATFAFFVSCMNSSIAIAGPYFAVYMLKDLNFSYLQFMSLTGIQLTVQFLTMQYWGRLSDQFGNKRILEVSTIGLVVIPLFWLISDNFWALLVVQSYSGLFWAGYNLSAANFLFDAVKPPKRARCAAYMSLVNGVLVFTAALIGGFLSSHLPEGLPLEHGISTPNSPLLRIFFISACLRLLSVIYFLRRIREVREVESIKSSELIFRIASVRPLSGATFSLVTWMLRRADRK